MAAHVDEVAQKYKIPCYLEEAKIRALYGFDFHYRATASAQEEAWRKVHELLQQNRNVSRAIEFAQGDIKEKLDQCIRELDQKQEQLLQEAKASDQAAYEKKQSDYCSAAQKADETVARLYQDACAQREKDYQDLREKAQLGKTIADFQAGRDMLSEGLKNYKDSNQLAELCKEKEQALRMQRELGEKRYKKKRKIILVVVLMIVVASVIAAGALWYRVATTANRERAAAIMEHFPGKSMSCVEISENDFNSWSLGYRNTYRCTFEFNADGTYTETDYSQTEYTEKYKESLKAQHITWDEDGDTNVEVGTYSVFVPVLGDIMLIIDTPSNQQEVFSLTVDANNEPVSFVRDNRTYQ